MIDGIIKGTGNSRKLKSVSNFLSLYPTYADFAAALIAGTLPIDLAGINADGWQQLATALSKGNLLSDATAAKFRGNPQTVNAALSEAADAFGKLGTAASDVDLDACIYPGSMLVFATSAHWPSAANMSPWGLLLVEANGSGGLVQTLTTSVTAAGQVPFVFKRMYQGVFWSEWVPIGNTLIASGSYTGTGTSGSANPTTITTPFPAKTLLMFGANGAPIMNASNGYAPMFGNPSLLTTSYQENALFSFYSNGYMWAKKSSDGKTIAWYHPRTDAPDYQFNHSGQVYNWLALG